MNPSNEDKPVREESLMPSSSLMAATPEAAGLDGAKVNALLERAQREVKEGLLPAVQIAIARNGKIGAMRTFGHAVQVGRDQVATNETLFVIFSCTKALISAAAWLLIQDCKVKESEVVAE